MKKNFISLDKKFLFIHIINFFPYRTIGSSATLLYTCRGLFYSVNEQYLLCPAKAQTIASIASQVKKLKCQ
jgi:hypothetical protein